MRRLITHLIVALVTFGVGLTAGVVWYAKRSHLNTQPPMRTVTAPLNHRQEEPDLPLVPEAVARALQTRQILTKHLAQNSDDDMAWRWLKQAISEYQSTSSYKQHSLMLPLSDAHDYIVVIHTSPLSQEEVEYFNEELQKEGRPALRVNRRYSQVQVNYDQIACPVWSGVVDLEALKLVFFRGEGA